MDKSNQVGLSTGLSTGGATSSKTSTITVGNSLPKNMSEIEQEYLDLSRTIASIDSLIERLEERTTVVLSPAMPIGSGAVGRVDSPERVSSFARNLQEMNSALNYQLVRLANIVDRIKL